jgi:hypothetical protein
MIAFGFAEAGNRSPARGRAEAAEPAPGVCRPLSAVEEERREVLESVWREMATQPQGTRAEACRYLLLHLKPAGIAGGGLLSLRAGGRLAQGEQKGGAGEHEQTGGRECGNRGHGGP